MQLRLAAILAGSLAAGPALAEPAPPPQENSTAVFPLMRLVPKGEARTIAFYTNQFPDCSQEGPVVIRILAKPKHGKVAIEDAESFARYAPDSPMVACNTRKAPGKRMVYESEEGFEGLDTFRILVINSDGTGYESDVKVSVR
jgi:hypothetical protein